MYIVAFQIIPVYHHDQLLFNSFNMNYLVHDISLVMFSEHQRQNIAQIYILYVHFVYLRSLKQYHFKFSFYRNYFVQKLITV